MPKKGQTARPPSGPRRLEERKPNVMLIYSRVCVFLIQLSTQFVNTTQIACPTNLVSQKTNNLEANCFEDFF